MTMPENTHYETALELASEILDLLARTPEAAKALRLGGITFLILDAINEVERRLSELPKLALCVHCFLPAIPLPGAEGGGFPCPACGQDLPLPSLSHLN